VQTDRELLQELGPSSSRSPDEAFGVFEVSGIDGTEKWTSQLISEFDTEFDVDSHSTVAAVDLAPEPRVCVVDAPHAPHTLLSVAKSVSTVSLRVKLRTLMRLFWHQVSQ